MLQSQSQSHRHTSQRPRQAGPEPEPDWQAAAVWQVFVAADVDTDGYLCSAEYRRLLQATAVWQVRLPPSIWPRLARAWLA